MKTLLLILFFGLTSACYSQNCSQLIPPAVNIPEGGIYHIFENSNINDSVGSIYYLCPGVHLTIASSGGCVIYMEQGSQLTIINSDGDVIYAKGGCTITDISMQSNIISMESSSSYTGNGIVLLCPSVDYDYSMVGGSSPCGGTNNLNDELKKEILMFPNPLQSGENLSFNETIQSLELYNLKGHLLYQVNGIGTKSLKLPTLSSGMYIANVSIGDDKPIQMKLSIE
ncbi:MAG: T9SS type A sorting domain-containing protein [Crocinitomicaceae bacterium]|jgi:hypothetical protein|nr:T9SS type A sorting domain-containing protein [Crocinitomicaceae bacterium]